MLNQTGNKEEMNMAQISITRINRQDKGNLKAFCNVDINGKIEIYGVRLLDGKNGLFLSMPSRKGQDDKYYDHVRIKDEPLRDQVLAAVKKAYDAGGQGGGSEEPPKDDAF